MSPELRGFVDALKELGNGLRHEYRANALEEVEQEREVELQVEQVRQIQKPNKHMALAFPGIHPAIDRFFQTGLLNSGVFAHAFSFIARTSIGQKFKVRKTRSNLFVSDQFCQTVKVKRGDSTINFIVSISTAW